MGGFLYPRQVTFYRRPKTTQAGPAGYGGIDPKDLDIIVGPIKANIQDKGTGRGGGVGSPADTVPAQWMIYTELGDVADGQLCDRDIAVDDLGRRFQISGDYVHSMGGKFRCDRLET